MTYQGDIGAPRDPDTPGGYCLRICRCGQCPQYAEQAAAAAQLREQEYQARIRTEGDRWARQQKRTQRLRAVPTEPDRAPAQVTARFREFHASNPHLMERLVELVEQHVDAGARRLGIGALFEELRGHVETNGDRYALNNTLRADYVRQLITDHPEWSHLFELRQRRSA